jgi:hypothetical protein
MGASFYGEPVAKMGKQAVSRADRRSFFFIVSLLLKTVRRKPGLE